MHKIARVIFFASAILVLSAPAIDAVADDSTSTEHFVSMRSFVTDNGPRFVIAADVANEERATPFQGCDGHLYYLSASDAADVVAALGAGDTVQMNEGTAGSSPAEAAIVCLLQAEQ